MQAEDVRSCIALSCGRLRRVMSRPAMLGVARLSGGGPVDSGAVKEKGRKGRCWTMSIIGQRNEPKVHSEWLTKTLVSPLHE